MAEYDYGSDDSYLGFYAPPAPSYDPSTDYGFGYTPPPSYDYGDYSNEGRNYPTPESTQGPGGSPVNATTYDPLGSLPPWLRDAIKALGGNLTSGKGLSALGGALIGASEKRKPSGGGTTERYAGPMQMNRTMAQGKYGPIAQYNPTPAPVRAAYGGMMQGYAQGGPVQMEDGGFVMTKSAVDGAGGPQGIQQLVPGARMVNGPGTGTSDDIPAVINGRRGQTPALLSNGEAYVPKPVVDGQGGAQQMYALMKQLQRRG